MEKDYNPLDIKFKFSKWRGFYIVNNRPEEEKKNQRAKFLAGIILAAIAYAYMMPSSSKPDLTKTSDTLTKTNELISK